MRREVLIGAGMFAGVVLGGCAASGPAFERVTDIPQDKGVIYVYRPNSIIGSAVRYDVFANDELVCNLVRGGYCLHYAKPGEVEFWGKTEAKGSITIDVKAGQEHYVKGSLSMGILLGRPNLTLVEPKDAMGDLTECKLQSVQAAKTEEGR